MADLDFDNKRSGVEIRTYTERIFFNLIDGKLVPKKTARIDCSQGVPDHLAQNRIYLLTDFKKDVRRGRKDRLKGRDVVAFFSDKGWQYVPLDEILEYGRSIYSYGLSLQKSIDQKPDTSEE